MTTPPDVAMLWEAVDASATLAARFGFTDAEQVVSWLSGEGLPVADPIVAADGRLRVEHDHFSVGLYPVMGGALLDVANVHAVESAGRTLARLHHALARYPGRLGGDPQQGHRTGTVSSSSCDPLPRLGPDRPTNPRDVHRRVQRRRAAHQH